MKKYIIIVFAVFSAYIVSAQTTLDALRFSQLQYGGTARFVGMGSSFGALGAETSTMSTNPAGIALYRGGEFCFTPALLNDNVNSTFNGNKTTDYDAGFLFNNLGFTIAFNDDNSTSEWKGATFGFAYNRLANFRQNILIEGTNDVGSMIDLFVDNANIQDPAGLQDGLNSFYERGAWETYLIDYMPGTEYWSPVKDDNIHGETQRKTIRTTGGIGEFDFSFAVNYKDMLYIGGTMGVQNVNYHEVASYKESNIPYSAGQVDVVTPDSSYSYINDSPESFTLDEDLSIKGSGLNFKIGLIFRPIDWLRIGAAFHTNTFLSLTDNYRTEFSTKFTKTLPGFRDFTDYNYDTQGDPYNYELTTPSHFIGSIGVVIRKIAIVSLEYENVNYGKARYRAYEADFTETNQEIFNSFNSVNILRAGAEVKIGSASIRGGFGYYGNPYSKELNRIDASQLVYSGGIGLTGGNFYVDFAYSLTQYQNNYFLYNGYVEPVAEPVPVLDFSRGIGMLTFGVKF